MNVQELKEISFQALLDKAYKLGVTQIKNNQPEVIVGILKKMFKEDPDVEISGEGILEILSEGYGFLRCKLNNFRPNVSDIYVSPNQIRRCSLRSGDHVVGTLRLPKSNERYFSLNKVDLINGVSIHEKNKQHVSFDHSTPIHPDQQIVMEIGNGSQEDITTRLIDLITPIGLGQRGLIVAPPKVGKTTLMQNIASSIAINYPKIKLVVLLVDERPEEVTEMRRTVQGDVIASTFDEPASCHIQAAELTIEYAKRLAEQKEDVVILLDSITRLARAYNTMTPTSGRVLTGGVDANALQKPKRFFGAARNLEEGGSITIIATALVDTGSKMDEVIFQEFKGTGNCEIQLDRRLAEKRTFPAININQSGTRRENVFLNADKMSKIWILRKMFYEMDEISATEFLIDKLKIAKTNQEFFDSMKK